MPQCSTAPLEFGFPDLFDAAMTTASAFLRHYPPFDRFEADALAFLDARLKTERFPAGSSLVSPEQGEPNYLYLVVSGKVDVTQGQGASIPGEADFQVSVGECFPIGSLSGRRTSANRYIAATDTECYLLPAADFQKLLEVSAVFARHCSSYLSSLVGQSRRQLQAHFSQQASEQQSLQTELRTLIKHAPFALAANATIQEAVQIMGDQRIGSIVVVDDSGAPIGIFTQSDVLRRIVLAKTPLDQPLSEVMSLQPMTISENAHAYDAMFSMASRGIRHVLLVNDNGQLTGVLSERDLFALQRIGIGQVRRAIESAKDIQALQSALNDVRQSAFNMIAQGVGAEQLTQFISTLNDSVTQRVIEINLLRHDLADIEWAWLAFGSEGREEQTLSTDQDNGIVFLAEAAQRDGYRERLLAFAREVNSDLDRCGFTLCKGNIMAGNPEWCLSLDEWKARFNSWVRSPQPQALLNATIFFDLRALFGRRELADRMYAHLFSMTRNDNAFQRMLAANALEVSAPLGVFRDFVTESDEQGKAFIDLKKFGSRLFVDAARVFALVHGIDNASTTARLRRTATLPGGAGEGVEALIDAFHFIQLLRLRHQHLETAQGKPGDNRAYIGRLNKLDRRILKESFRQVKSLQLRLKLTYQL